MECWILFHREDYETSNEAGCHEIRRLIEVGNQAGIHMHVFRPERFHLVTSHKTTISLLLDGEEISLLPDIVLPRMGVLSSYFALSIIRQFERMGVSVFNGTGAISTVMDKMRTQQVLAHAGLPVPKTMLARFPVDLDLVEKSIGFPLVAKTLAGSHGQGVILCENKDQFGDIMALIEETNPAAQIIFQEFVAETHGRDLRVFVVDGQVIGCMQRKSTNGSFKANISHGGIGETFPLEKNGQKLAIKVAKTLNLDISGIDLLFSESGYKICEANSAPDFKGMESFCDVPVAEHIVAALKRRVWKERISGRALVRAGRGFFDTLSWAADNSVSNESKLGVL